MNTTDVLRKKFTTNALRVVFDTNVFDATAFHLISESRLALLTRERRVVPVYGHVFIEETLSAYGNEGKREALINKWLPFIVSASHSFCNDLNTIWHEELVQGRGLNARIEMRRDHYDRLIAQLPKIPLDGTWRAWHASKEAREIEYAKRAAQRELSKDMRKTVADWRKAIRYSPRRHGTVNLDSYLEGEVNHAGHVFVEHIVKARHRSAIATQWSRNKSQYPFFTSFVIEMLYLAHHAMMKPNEGIDLNAQADLNLMTHLLHSDVLVSNETGFLKTAFHDLWSPRGKFLFDSEQFVRFLEEM